MKKDVDPLQKAKRCIKEGRYLIKRHAKDRGLERNITLPDILEIIQNGYHEKRKDEWKIDFQRWNYSIRGKSTDQRDCRIVISFNDFGMLVVTVIALEE